MPETLTPPEPTTQTPAHPGHADFGPTRPDLAHPGTALRVIPPYTDAERDRGFRLQRLGALAVTVIVTGVLFSILPLLQTISQPPTKDLLVRSVDVAEVPPPPPPPEQEEQKKEEPPPPELSEPQQPLDLSQLELALNPGFGLGDGGDFAIKLPGQEGASDDLDKIFSLGDLDSKPRPVFQSAPVYPQDLLRRGIKGNVSIVFIVDRSGRVQNPVVEKTTDPRFDRAALDAVRQWRFEPGTRQGQEVQFKMRVPLNFNAG